MSSALSHSPREGAETSELSHDSDLLCGAACTRLCCLQSPAERDPGTVEGLQVFLKSVLYEEGWDGPQVAPPLALMDGVIMIQAAVLLLVPRVP